MAERGLEVDLEDLTARSEKALVLAGRVRRLSLRVSAAGQGMPGADAVALLAQTQAGFEEDLGQWANSSQFYGIRLDIAEKAYRRGDDAGARAFNDLRLDMMLPDGPLMRGPGDAHGRAGR